MLARSFAALSDPIRLRLLSFIASADADEVCACDLIEPSGRSQPTVSHHMKILVDAGLVTREKRGLWVWYRLVPVAPRRTQISTRLAPNCREPALRAAAHHRPHRGLSRQRDDRRWFTGSSSVGKIDPTVGVVSTTPLSGEATGITVAPNGTVWVAEISSTSSAG